MSAGRGIQLIRRISAGRDMQGLGLQMELASRSMRRRVLRGARRLCFLMGGGRGGGVGIGVEERETSSLFVGAGRGRRSGPWVGVVELGNGSGPLVGEGEQESCIDRLRNGEVEGRESCDGRCIAVVMVERESCIHDLDHRGSLNGCIGCVGHGCRIDCAG